MKRFQVFGLTAALVAGWGSAASAADPVGEKTTLVKKLFGPSAPKPAGPAVPGGTPQRPVTINAPLPPEQLAEALRAEQEAYLRRVSVCTELRRVAVERGDDALIRQADELERQVSSLYNARVAALGVARARAPLPESNMAQRGSERPAAVSADPVSTRLAANRLTAPATPVPGTTTAQTRQVNP